MQAQRGLPPVLCCKRSSTHTAILAVSGAPPQPTTKHEPHISNLGKPEGASNRTCQAVKQTPALASKLVMLRRQQQLKLPCT